MAIITNITDEVRPTVHIYGDYETAMSELVITPLADFLGLSEEDVRNEFDLELIFENILTYDSINGVEGWRHNPEVPEVRELNFDCVSYLERYSDGFELDY